MLASKQGFDYDVCVIGTGRVGLPLALSFLDVGLRVVGVDKDASLRRTVNDGRMPFMEPGYDDLVAERKLRVFEDASIAAQARSIVVTVGTPLHTHIETDLSQIRRVLQEVGPHLRKGQLVVLRSTVAPGTTEYVRRWIERHTELRVGDNVFLSFCPERIAEGKAYEELKTLPQIIGAEDDASYQSSKVLFQRLTKDILRTNYVSAELVKLFNNVARYVHFALANQFALIADTYGANIYEIRRMANYKYSRSYIPMPGLTAGTCLRKDFGMLNEWNPYPDLLLSAWKMNEYIPAFLVDHLEKRVDIHGKRVAILGYSFKADTDDIRDSLAPKLHRYIERRLPIEIRVADKYLPSVIDDPINGKVTNHDERRALEDAEIVFVATNHGGYGDLLREWSEEHADAWVVDIWNVGETDRIFYQAGILREVR